MKLNLTERDILNKKFSKNVKGYDANEVDVFLDIVLEDYRALDKVISEANTSKDDLTRTVESLKAEIRSLNDALKIEKSKNEVLKKTKDTSSSELDPLDLLEKCGKYEIKLSELGVDLTKFK